MPTSASLKLVNSSQKRKMRPFGKAPLWLALRYQRRKVVLCSVGIDRPLGEASRPFQERCNHITANDKVVYPGSERRPSHLSREISDYSRAQRYPARIMKLLQPFCFEPRNVYV